MPAIAIPWDPDLFAFGPVRITWHSLFAIIGMLVGVWVARRLGRRTPISDEQVTTLAFWALGGGIVMARLLYVIDNLDHFSHDWIQVFAFANGGITVWGAPIGGAIAVAGSAWWMKLNVPTALDIGAPGLILGMAVGRVGDLINGEHGSLPTDLAWAVFYTHPNTVGQSMPVHPATTYELLGDLALFVLALFFARRHMNRLYAFWTVLAGYATLRFGLQFLRIDQPQHLLGLQQSQIISAVVLLCFVGWLTNRVRHELAASTDSSPGKSRNIPPTAPRH